jgi:type I restriction enzyme S subunit
MSSGSQAAVGKSAPLRHDWNGSVGAFCAIVRPQKSRVEPEFLALYMRSEAFRTWTRKSEGANIKNIRHSELLGVRIPVPPIDEQRRAVEVLSRAEGIVRMRREAEQRAKEIIPALFLDMFGDPATNPKGWDAKSLAALVTFVSGGTPSKSRNDYWQGRLPWVSPKDMKVPEIFDAEDHISDQVPVQTSIKLIPPGAVLIVVRGMILVHTVPVAITRAPVTVNQDMKALRANGFVNEEYLMWLLRISQRWLLTLVTTAAHGTRKIDTARLEALPIPVPPKALQESFVQRVRTLLDVTGSQSRAMERAEQSFQALLAGVFSVGRAT